MNDCRRSEGVGWPRLLFALTAPEHARRERSKTAMWGVGDERERMRDVVVQARCAPAGV